VAAFAHQAAYAQPGLAAAVEAHRDTRTAPAIPARPWLRARVGTNRNARRRHSPEQTGSRACGAAQIKIVNVRPEG